MVGQAAEGLQNDKGTAALLGMVQDLAGDQDALARIEGVGDDGIAEPGQILDAGRLLIQGIGRGDAVGQVMGGVEQTVRRAEPDLFRRAAAHMLFLDLAVLVEVGFLG